MQGHRLSANVETVTILQQNANGEVTPVVLYKRDKKKKRKTSGGLSIVEKILEQAMDAGKETTDSYQRRFKQSSRDKRDGWIIDMPRNMFRAVRDGARVVRLERII